MRWETERWGDSVCWEGMDEHHGGGYVYVLSLLKRIGKIFCIVRLGDYASVAN